MYLTASFEDVYLISLRFLHHVFCSALIKMSLLYQDSQRKTVEVR